MNKNWNDRADKDLFFTILSVKNIGVISGSEWTTIGNHMRTLGYVFTNEGCRQHFQGLRRAQHKVEVNGTMSDSPRKTDPTMNPITRRPGPGRGRPRKLPPAPVAQDSQDVVPGAPVQPQGHPQPQIQTQTQTQPAPAPTASDPVAVHGSVPVPMPVGVSDVHPQLPHGLPEPDSLGLVAAEPDDEGELDEQPSKRQRIDDGPDQMDDEAILALAAEGTTGTVDHYPAPDYNFEEA